MGAQARPASPALHRSQGEQGVFSQIPPPRLYTHSRKLVCGLYRWIRWCFGDGAWRSTLRTLTLRSVALPQSVIVLRAFLQDPSPRRHFIYLFGAHPNKTRRPFFGRGGGVSPYRAWVPEHLPTAGEGQGHCENLGACGGRQRRPGWTSFRRPGVALAGCCGRVASPGGRQGAGAGWAAVRAAGSFPSQWEVMVESGGGGFSCR